MNNLLTQASRFLGLQTQRISSELEPRVQEVAKPPSPPPTPPATFEASVTEGEMQRRIRDAIDEAIAAHQTDYLSVLDTLYNATPSITATAVTYSCGDEVQLRTIRDWSRAWFTDCCREPKIYLYCTGAPSATDIAKAQSKFAEAAQVHMTQIGRAVFAPGRVGGASSPSINCHLKYESRTYAQFMVALRDHLKLRATEYLETAGEVANIPIRKRVSAFLTQLLAQSSPSQPADETSKAETSLASSGTASPGQNIEAALSLALAKRLSLFAQKQAASMPPDISEDKWLKGGLKKALRDGDPLDLAAAACLLWQARERVRASKVAERLLDQSVEESGSLPGLAGDRPGQSSDAEAKAKVDWRTELLTVEELSDRIKYDARTIRDVLVDKAFIQETHYVRSLGGRRYLFKWASVIELMGIPLEEWDDTEELLTTDELAPRIRYDVRTLRERLVGVVLLKPEHYIQPFQGRKILFRWSKVSALMGISHLSTK